MGQYTIILFSFYILKILTDQNKIFQIKNDLVILMSLLCFLCNIKNLLCCIYQFIFLIFLKIKFKDFYFFLKKKFIF